jgi:DNA-binding SARP family transcriptional activator
MRFRVLGPLELRDDQGRLVRLGAAKQCAVLGVLLVHANRPVGVDLLAEALWGERPPRSAVGGLRTYVSALRQSLGLNARAGGAWITALPGAYQLTVAAEELDLLVFERCADEGQRALADGQLRLAAERLEKALGLWRGRPLEDLPLMAILDGALVGLEERRLAVVTAWAQACLALGRHEELLPELGRLVIAEPLWSGCGSCGCWRCTARAARRRHWRPTGSYAGGWCRSSVLSPARPCNGCNDESCRVIGGWWHQTSAPSATASRRRWCHGSCRRT